MYEQQFQELDQQAGVPGSSHSEAVVRDEFKLCEKKIRGAFNHQLRSEYDWDEVVDVRTSSLARARSVDLPLVRCTSRSRQLSVYEIEGTPDGLYVIPNALTVEEQLMWTKTAVETYSRVEHTNLLNLKRLKAEDADVYPKQVTEEQKKILAGIFARSIREAELDEADPDRDLWHISVAEKNGLLSFQKLRWASLGYHYDWTSRRYYKDVCGDFPVDLSCLVQNLASLVGETMRPEAAIVNYYPMNATMGGHLDDAELSMERPIVSISLGCPAIFLIGGRTRSARPTAILLRSGDVLIMSRESRYCVHGVPRILRLDDVDSELLQCLSKKATREGDGIEEAAAVDAVELYLRTNRVNINVRQVAESSRSWHND